LLTKAAEKCQESETVFLNEVATGAINEADDHNQAADDIRDKKACIGIV
jgi:uncharacterized protein with ACT and thioredoxin-like domain